MSKLNHLFVLPVLAHIHHLQKKFAPGFATLSLTTKIFLTPFHLPVCTVVAGKSPAIENTMESKLYFNSNCIRKLSWHHCAACHCVQLRQQHPELRTTSIHGLILLRKPSSCMFPVGCILAVLHCNRTSVSRLLKNTIARLVASRIDKRRDFLCQQWTQHRQLAQVLMSMEDWRFLRQLTHLLVVQGREHAAHHIHVFCPVL